jgi:hypothetical protein
MPLGTVCAIELAALGEFQDLLGNKLLYRQGRGDRIACAAICVLQKGEEVGTEGSAAAIEVRSHVGHEELPIRRERRRVSQSPTPEERSVPMIEIICPRGGAITRSNRCK